MNKIDSQYRLPGHPTPFRHTYDPEGSLYMALSVHTTLKGANRAAERSSKGKAKDYVKDKIRIVYEKGRSCPFGETFYSTLTFG
jgi:hypothetical protein